MEFALTDILQKRDVVLRVPIQRVEYDIKRYRIEHFVDGNQHF